MILKRATVSLYESQFAASKNRISFGNAPIDKLISKS